MALRRARSGYPASALTTRSHRVPSGRSARLDQSSQMTRATMPPNAATASTIINYLKSKPNPSSAHSRNRSILPVSSGLIDTQR